jgi:hypothetical protein
MSSVEFLYSFRGASWYIPCKILEKYNHSYKIEYEDPMLSEWENISVKTTLVVTKDQLKFPSFIDMVIP